MSDDVILDAVVDRGSYHAAIHKILLSPIGPEAHNAPGPHFCHAGDLEQLAKAGVVDVYPVLGRRGCGRRPGIAVDFPWLFLGWCGRTDAEKKGSDRNNLQQGTHAPIFGLGGAGRKKKI